MADSILAMFKHKIGKEKTNVVNIYLHIRIYLILFISFECKKVEKKRDNLHRSGTLKHCCNHSIKYAEMAVSLIVTPGISLLQFNSLVCPHSHQEVVVVEWELFCLCKAF